MESVLESRKWTALECVGTVHKVQILHFVKRTAVPSSRTKGKSRARHVGTLASCVRSRRGPTCTPRRAASARPRAVRRNTRSPPPNRAYRTATRELHSSLGMRGGVLWRVPLVCWRGERAGPSRAWARARRLARGRPRCPWSIRPAPKPTGAICMTLFSTVRFLRPIWIFVRPNYSSRSTSDFHTTLSRSHKASDTRLHPFSKHQTSNSQRNCRLAP